MDLVERYLQAVQFWLPSDQKRDIVAELGDAIRSRIEEKESELGRTLSDGEVEQVLKSWGTPLIVAGRYAPQGYLIGPAVFPIYKIVLRSAFLIWIGPWALTWIALAKFGTWFPWERLWQSFWLCLLLGFTLITLVFAGLERNQSEVSRTGSWNPRKLPAVRDPNRISRANAIGEAVWYTLLSLWFVGLFELPEFMGVEIVLAPVWRTIAWPLLAVLVSMCLLAYYDAVNPWWTRFRAGIRAVINTGGLLICLLLISTRPLFEVALAGMSPAKIDGLNDTMHWIAVMILAVSMITLSARVVQDVRRLMGLPPIAGKFMHGLTSD